LYLPSKIKLKYIVLFLLFVFLAFLPFKDAVRSLVIFFPNKLLFAPSNKYVHKIEKLRGENAVLKLQIESAAHLREENKKLRKAFDFKVKKKVDLLGAEVIAFIPSSWRRLALINKGRRDGVEEGLFAIDEDGNLLGKILEVEKETSRVILVDDPEFSVSVFVGKGSFGLLKGNLIGAKILYIENEAEINAHDKVWLKILSLGSVINVGEVKRIKNNENDLFLNIDVEPFTKNSFFDKVFIVK